MTNPTNWLDLEEKVAVITGAVGGMGRTIAEELAKQRVHLALIDIQEESAKQFASELSDSYGISAVGFRCDTTNEQEVEQTVQAVVEKFSKVDILVNTAAILKPALFENLTIEEWNQTLSINLTGYFLTSQRFGRVMIAQGKGTIIHISTLLSEFPETYSGAYSISKAGVNMLSKQMAAEWGIYGIRSNCILPSLVKTPLSMSFYSDPDVLKRRENVTASKRIGTTQDIANAVLYLASDRSDYTNGAELLVEGGLGIMIGDQIAKPGGRKEYAIKHGQH